MQPVENCRENEFFLSIYSSFHYNRVCHWLSNLDNFMQNLFGEMSIIQNMNALSGICTRFYFGMQSEQSAIFWQVASSFRSRKTHWSQSQVNGAIISYWLWHPQGHRHYRAQFLSHKKHACAWHTFANSDKILILAGSMQTHNSRSGLGLNLTKPRLLYVHSYITQSTCLIYGKISFIWNTWHLGE